MNKMHFIYLHVILDFSQSFSEKTFIPLLKFILSFCLLLSFVTFTLSQWVCLL